MQSSMLAPLNAALDSLRCLLEEEDSSFAQLTYVVEHIYTPLLQGCDSSLHPHFHRAREEKQQCDASYTTVPFILTFAQHWELFANVATLHKSQAVLRERLEVTLRECTALLEQQQQLCELHAEDNRSSFPSRTAKLETRRDAEEDKLDENSLHGPTNAVVVSLCNILRELFCSSPMRHYIAEHMMYSFNYSRNIAPRVLDIARLWATHSGTHGAAYLMPREFVFHPRRALNSEERSRLETYLPLLRFLLSELGDETGVPHKRGASFVHLAEMPRTDTQEEEEEPKQTQTQPQQQSRSRALRSNRASSAKNGLPPLPGVWRGFETFLLLLATPLASLRRYVHVGRCLVESPFMPKLIRRALQVEFFDIAAHRVVEESSIVLEELARQDVAHIMSLIDDVPAGFDGKHKKTTGACPHTEGNRALVHYGRIVKKFRRGRHERLMFLFSDWLCYVEEQVNNRLRLRGSIPLHSLKVVELDDAPFEDIFHAFKIVTADTSRTFFASTLEQRQQWVTALRETAQRHQKIIVALPFYKQTGDVTKVVRPAAPPLSHLSRLRRQQRADKRENVWRDRQRLRAAAHAEIKTACLSETAHAAAEGTAETAEKKQSESQAHVFVRENRHLTHGSFDVTHWAKQSTEAVHVRIRSADLLSFSPSMTRSEKDLDGEKVRVEAGAAAARVDGKSPQREIRLLSERFDAPNVSSLNGSRSQPPVFSAVPMVNEKESVFVNGKDKEADGAESEYSTFITLAAQSTSAGEEDHFSHTSEDEMQTSTPRTKGARVMEKKSPEPNAPLHSARPVAGENCQTSHQNSSECSGETEASTDVSVPTNVVIQRHIDPTADLALKKDVKGEQV